MASLRSCESEDVPQGIVVATAGAAAPIPGILPTPGNENQEITAVFDACCDFVDGVRGWIEGELHSSRVAQLDHAFLATDKGKGYR